MLIIDEAGIHLADADKRRLGAPRSRALPDADSEAVPETGDSSFMWMWVILAFLSASTLGTCVYSRRRLNKK